jgi:predicted DNA-binding transcriptional regulator AlpA
MAVSERERQRRAEQREQASEDRRGWVAQKAAPRTPSADDSHSAPPATERPLPERARPPPGKDLLSYCDLKSLGLPWSRTHLYRVIAAGRFPRPISTGPNTYDRKMWLRTDYENWLASLQPVAEPAE